MPKETRSRNIVTLDVLRTEHLTPHMIRVVAGGPGLADYRHNEFTDRYVKLVFLSDGVDYDEPLDLRAIRRDRPQAEWPRIRTYTVRRYDAAAAELWIDFVYHGDEGVAGPWAKHARPGDKLRFMGPGGAYTPDPAADWHLFVGDEAAFPAIAAALEELPAGAVARAVLQAGSAPDIVYLDVPHGVEVRWLLRDRDDPGLTDAVRALEFPTGRVHAFVHCELDEIRTLRAYLLDELGLTRREVSMSGYWREGKEEDGSQAEKLEATTP